MFSAPYKNKVGVPPKPLILRKLAKTAQTGLIRESGSEVGT